MLNPQGQPPVGKAGTPGADKLRQPQSARDSDPWGTERGDSGPLTRTVCGHEGGRPPGPLPLPLAGSAAHGHCIPSSASGSLTSRSHWGPLGAGCTARSIQSQLRPEASALPQPLSSPHTPHSLPFLRPPHCPAPHPAPSSCPLTHDGRPGHGAVLGPVVQANGGDGSVPREGDQRGDHELAALLGQKPRGSQGHWWHCQETQGKAWPTQPTQPSDTEADSVLWALKITLGLRLGLGTPLGWGETRCNR